mmetsp:Transcript_45066/g.139056  ORF Transcript_45066/g.139056 Transcript_45066/m.139056 type:complete len:333 (-) Transcript_45066:56-1054(-)
MLSVFYEPTEELVGCRVQVLPPLLIIKGKPGGPISKEKLECPHEVSDNGWMNEDVMIKWIGSLPKPPVGRIAWLVVDVYAAHRTSRVVSEAKARGYRFLFIPPGCTSKLQIHDVFLNKPFKQSIRAKYNKRCADAINKKEQPAPMTRDVLARWVKHANAALEDTKLLAKGYLSCLMTDEVRHDIMRRTADKAQRPAQQLQLPANPVPVDLLDVEADVDALLARLAVSDVENAEAEQEAEEMGTDEPLEAENANAEVGSDSDDDLPLQEPRQQPPAEGCCWCNEHPEAASRRCQHHGCTRKMHHFCAIAQFGEPEDGDDEIFLCMHHKGDAKK